MLITPIFITYFAIIISSKPENLKNTCLLHCSANWQEEIPFLIVWELLDAPVFSYLSSKTHNSFLPLHHIHFKTNRVRKLHYDGVSVYHSSSIHEDKKLKSCIIFPCANTYLFVVIVFEIRRVTRRYKETYRSFKLGKN